MTNNTYFGFAFSAAMLPAGEVNLHKVDLTIDEVKELLPNCKMCLNPSHRATIEAALSIGLKISIPEKPARISLGDGDSVVVMQVRGLPRLTDRHEYAPEEIAQANFSFVRLTIASMD